MSSFLNIESSVLVSTTFFHWGARVGVIVSILEVSRLFSWSSFGRVLNFGLKSSEGRVQASFNS